MVLRKSKLLYFIASYSIIVSSYIIVTNSIIIINYLRSFNIAFPTISGMGLIIPLYSVSQIILSLLGLIGGILLLRFNIKGFIICLLWSLLQIPIILYEYGLTAKEALLGSKAINIQLFFINYRIHSEYPITYSLFTVSPNIFAYAIFINFVGIILTILLLLLLIDSSDVLAIKVNNVKRKIFNVICIILSSSLIITIINTAAKESIDYWKEYNSRINFSVLVDKMETPYFINYVINNEELKCFILEVSLNITNHNKEPHSIKRIYLEMVATNRYPWQDLPMIDTFFPVGSNEGAIARYHNSKVDRTYANVELYKKTPKGIIKYNYDKIRIEGKDDKLINLAFIIPRDSLVRDESNYDYMFGKIIKIKGNIVIVNIDGDNILSKFDTAVLLPYNKMSTVKIDKKQ